MAVWLSVVLCLGNVVSSLAGMAALKQAVTTGSVVFALAGIGCWVLTAICIALLMLHQPIVWIALISSCLSVLGSVVIGTLFFGEPLAPAQIVGLVLILVALVLTASAG